MTLLARRTWAAIRYAPSMTPRLLLLVDVQRGLAEATDRRRNHPRAEAVAGTLLRAWREAGWPVIHVRHASLEPDSPLRSDRPGYAFARGVEPTDDEPVIVKHVNSAFIGTDLERRLRDGGHAALTVVGLTTDHCVSTTVRMAGNLGFDVALVDDATATFDRLAPDGRTIDADAMHAAHLASLDGEFCRVVTSDEILRRMRASGSIRLDSISEDAT